MTSLLETIDLRLRAALSEILAPEWVEQVAERLHSELRQPLEEATAAFVGVSLPTASAERGNGQLRRGTAGRPGRPPGRPKRAEPGASSTAHEPSDAASGRPSAGHPNQADAATATRAQTNAQLKAEEGRRRQAAVDADDEPQAVDEAALAHAEH